MCHGVCVKVNGQLVGVTSLFSQFSFLPGKTQRPSNSDEPV